MDDIRNVEQAYELGRRAGRQEVFDALPDQIDIIRAIKASGARKHGAIAQVIADVYVPVKETP
jgi:hypothetical protein